MISDFLLEPAALEPGVQALRARRHEVVLLQVIGRGELDPLVEPGVAELRDVESGALYAIACTDAVRARYRALVAEHEASLRQLAIRNEARWARLTSDADVATFVTDDLARLGLVRRR